MANFFASIYGFFKDVWVILKEIRRPRTPYILLSCIKVIIGILVIVMGIAAATTTPQYPMGAFWAGFFMTALGLYRLVVAFLRMLNIRKIDRHKVKLSAITTVASATCLLVCIAAAAVDGTASIYLVKTKFHMCRHTPIEIESPCQGLNCNPVFPPNTCYCCYLLDSMNEQCNTPLLLGKQPFFTRVHSCTDVSIKLLLLLVILTVLHSASAVLSFISMFKTTPLIFYYKIAQKKRLAQMYAATKNPGIGIIVTNLETATPTQDQEEEEMPDMMVEERQLLSDSSEL